MDTRLAIAFVAHHGDPIEQARLRYLLSREHPAQETVAHLLSGQRPDGGWAPFWASDYSSLDATCFRLAQAEQLGLSAAEPAIACAVAFLARRQRADGSWEEDNSVASAAPP